MKTMKKSTVVSLTYPGLVLGLALCAPVFADQQTSADTVSPGSVQTQTDGSGHAGESGQRELERNTSDAWREGKLDTVYLFNRHLNNFTIDPEVHGNTVVLTGKVESAVDKELAEQIALGIDGIDTVTNRLTVVPGDEARSSDPNSDRDFSDRVEDATLTAEVKMKLLANAETDGLDINVDTEAKVVTLRGSVDSSAEKDLAGQIAKNVSGVTKVSNELRVKDSA